MTTATTYANLNNLSDNFRKQILAYEGTKLGRQEIHAEIIDPEEGGIVKRKNDPRIPNNGLFGVNASKTPWVIPQPEPRLVL
jgi:phage terminase large subunit-like protein